MRNFMAALVVGMSVLGCTTTQRTSLSEEALVAKHVPSNYREKIVAYVKIKVRDPYSIRSAEISPPRMGFMGIQNGGMQPVVCARWNGRNAFGGYIGVTPTAFMFQNGEVVSFIERGLTCDGETKYSPFPELEQIT